MGGIYLLDMATVLRDAGLNVVEENGWEYRSRSSGGFDQFPFAVFWHHTASQTSPENDISYMNFGSDANPICNLFITREGVCHVMAGGATNTNGKGDGGRNFSRGRVEDDQANTHVCGVEIANNGVGEAYPQVQIDAAFAASNALNAYFGNLPSDVDTHTSYAPGRKIDPAKAAAVQGPWQPDSENSSGTWERQDLVDECVARATVIPPPIPPPGDQDMKVGPQTRVDSRTAGYQTTLEANEVRAVWMTVPPDCLFAQINVVILPLTTDSNGVASIGSNPPTSQSPNNTINWSAGDTRGQATSFVWTPDAKTVYIQSNVAAEFVLDFTGIYA